MPLLFILFFLLPSTIQATTYFGQISDIHYDPKYAVGSPTNCSLQTVGMTCCNIDSIPQIPYGSAGIVGEYSCDSSYNLVNMTLDFFSGFPMDFILWTGVANS